MTDKHTELMANLHPQLLLDCANVIQDDWPEFAEALTQKAIREEELRLVAQAAIAKAQGQEKSKK